VRIRLQHALFVATLAVMGLFLFLTVVVARRGLGEDLLERTRTELQRELLLVGDELGEGEPVSPDSVARFLASRIDHRVTFIDTAGVVLGDSDVPEERLPSVENHRDRPEVRGALRGELSFAERRSATVGRRLLYAARVIEVNGDPVVLRIASSLGAMERTLDRFQRTVGGAGFLALLAALVAAFLLSRTLARPIVTLADRARALAEGELDRRAPRRTRIRELDELGAAFNTLADELQARLGELSRERDQMQTLVDSMAEGVIALSEDARILRTNRAARELLDLPEPVLYAPVGSMVRQPELRDLLETAVVRPFRAREVDVAGRNLILSARLLEGGGAVVTFLDVTELRRLEQVRRDFVANATHELKTPLTSMRGFAETLLEDDPPPDLRERFLTSIHDNAVRLQRLVDDLLDLSRLESGGWMARREEVEVERVAREVWTELSDRAREKELEFEISGAARVEADEQGLSQILSNLLENSIQYTPEGGRIEVRVERRNGDVEVSVSDTGIGIPSSSLSRVFERFYRADPARSREAGGTGLGLAIVKHLVESMGGEVEARSRLGEGTTITFTVPSA